MILTMTITDIIPLPHINQYVPFVQSSLFFFLYTCIAEGKCDYRFGSFSELNALAIYVRFPSPSNIHASISSFNRIFVSSLNINHTMKPLAWEATIMKYTMLQLHIYTYMKVWIHFPPRLHFVSLGFSFILLDFYQLLL